MSCNCQPNTNQSCLYCAQLQVQGLGQGLANQTWYQNTTSNYHNSQQYFNQNLAAIWNMKIQFNPKRTLKMNTTIMLTSLIDDILESLVKDLPDDTEVKPEELADRVIRSLKLKAFL